MSASQGNDKLKILSNNGKERKRIQKSFFFIFLPLVGSAQLAISRLPVNYRLTRKREEIKLDFYAKTKLCNNYRDEISINDDKVSNIEIEIFWLGLQ